MEKLIFKLQVHDVSFKEKNSSRQRHIMIFPMRDFVIRVPNWSSLIISQGRMAITQSNQRFD